MNDVYKYKDFEVSPGSPISFKDIDGRKGIVTGYFASFNTVDGDGDVIKKGAFKKTIADSGPGSVKPRIKHILNHDWTQPLGVITTLKEDNKGLYYESQLGSHALGEDFVKMVDSGLITEHSIGFRTIKYNQVIPWADWREGDIARELTEIKLFEGSSLTFLGANQNTPLLSIKSEQRESKISKRIGLIIKALRNGSLTDDTCELLEIELKQMEQLLIDLSRPAQPATGQPEVKSTKGYACPICDGDAEEDPDDDDRLLCHKCNASFPVAMGKQKAVHIHRERKFTDIVPQMTRDFSGIKIFI